MAKTSLDLKEVTIF